MVSLYRVHILLTKPIPEGPSNALGLAKQCAFCHLRTTCVYLQMHNELGSGLEVTGVAVYICKQSYSVNYEKRVHCCFKDTIYAKSLGILPFWRLHYHGVR